jgi:hypothetical protein
LGKVQGILVSQWTDLGGIISLTGESTSSDLVDSQSSVEDIGWGISSHLLKLNWNMDSEEFVQMEETTTNSD